MGEQTYYKWQKRVFSLAKAQHESQFAEVAPPMTHLETRQSAIEYAEQDGARRPQPWCTQNAQMVQSCRVNGAQEEISV